MIQKEFDTPYSLVPTVVTVCEDTASCTVEWPTTHTKQDVIDWIDKNNYICVGIHGSTTSLAESLEYWLGGKILVDHSKIQEVKNTFL